MNIKSERSRKFLLAVTIICSFATHIPQVSAQELTLPDDVQTTKPTALGVDPAIVELVVDEAKPTLQKVLLTNLTVKPIPIKVSKQSFTFADRSEIPPDKLDIYDASSWITIEGYDKDFILQPLEQRHVVLKITQPKGASPGGHYASIIFQPLLPDEFISQQSLFVYARIAVLIFMQVKGDIIENIEVKDFEISTFNESVPIVGELTLKNNGNTHTRPLGEITFWDDLQNKMLKAVPLEPAVILPGLEKKIKVEFIDDITIGKVSAKASLLYGADNTPVESEKKEFYIVPYKLVAIFLLVGLFGYRIRARFRKALHVLLLEKSVKEEKKGKKKELHFTFPLSK